jgi:hypothetical protein
MSPPVATESMYKPTTIGTEAHDQALAAMKSNQAAPAKPVFKPEPAVNLEPIKFAPIKVGTTSLYILDRQWRLTNDLNRRSTKSNALWSAVTSKTWSVL